MQFIGNFSVSWGISKLNWSMANPFNFAESAFRTRVFLLNACAYSQRSFFPAEINSQHGPKNVDGISAFFFS